jgi:hypothetical protein
MTPLTSMSTQTLSPQLLLMRKRWRRGPLADETLWRQRLQAGLLFETPRETLANLARTGDLCCFSDQPVAEIVQCGEPISLTNFGTLKVNPFVTKRFALFLPFHLLRSFFWASRPG